MTRRCGDCQLCCTLLPVKQIGKTANKRCEFARFSKGCTLHSTRRMPMSCHAWSCSWLLDAPHLKRPDHGHYVVDMMPDFIVLGDPKTGQRVAAVQVWVDPRYPDAHEDAGLREYLAGRGRAEGVVAIIRYNARDGFVLVPPDLSETRQWMRLDSTMREETHSFAQIVEAGLLHAEARTMTEAEESKS